MRARVLMVASFCAAAAACALGDGAGGAPAGGGAAAGAAADTATAPACTAGAPSAPLPQKLSETGCFDAANPRAPSPALLAYDVNSPLWSDGALKSRWMAIPPGGTIRVGADGDWDLPVGSVLVKEFRVGGKRVETRLFMHHTDGSWAGYSYEWNDDESDAMLLDDGKTKALPAVDGAPSSSWTYPSREQCMTCHNAASGFSLGLETAQLNRAFDYADGPANQLDKLTALGLFQAPLAASRPALAPPSEEGRTDEDRARSYLHANCGFCHRPTGPGRGAPDFRFSRSLRGTHVCNMPPEMGDLGVPDSMLLVPGKPEESIISLRMHRTEGQRMPPLATALVDPSGTNVIDTWIRSLAACP